MVTLKGTVLEFFWGMYGKHRGGKHNNIAQSIQQKHTNCWYEKNLLQAKVKTSSFTTLVLHVDMITGLEDFMMDIIFQSSSGVDGCQETMFLTHLENNEDLPDYLFTAVILLKDTKSSMSILGKQTFEYMIMRNIAIFLSALFHETIWVGEGTMKLSVFLRRPVQKKHSTKG